MCIVELALTYPNYCLTSCQTNNYYSTQTAESTLNYSQQPTSCLLYINPLLRHSCFYCSLSLGLLLLLIFGSYRQPALKSFVDREKCYHPCLVSMLFADLLSLHLVTFLMREELSPSFCHAVAPPLLLPLQKQVREWSLSFCHQRDRLFMMSDCSVIQRF